jgi:hypothetical protein
LGALEQRGDVPVLGEKADGARAQEGVDHDGLARLVGDVCDGVDVVLVSTRGAGVLDAELFLLSELD